MCIYKKVLILCLSSAASTCCVDARMLDWKEKACSRRAQRREHRSRFILTSPKVQLQPAKMAVGMESWLSGPRNPTFKMDK